LFVAPILRQEPPCARIHRYLEAKRGRSAATKTSLR
jgi:hypothetical protein